MWHVDAAEMDAPEQGWKYRTTLTASLSADRAKLHISAAGSEVLYVRDAYGLPLYNRTNGHQETHIPQVHSPALVRSRHLTQANSFQRVRPPHCTQ